MSNYITRIKNNQITDSTILANVKIVPGSIVGSLFNANLTMTSDVTITGNLTVQGSSTYLTVASTNTYVNDPLIVLNNAFAGANLYDLGFIFNRGTSLNQAFYWDESSGEFRLIGTSETGTTYGNIASPTNYANLHIGNIAVDYDGSFRNITVTGTSTLTGDITLTGNLAVNGGVISTSRTYANVFNTNTTTLDIGRAATTVTIGATTGTANIRNANIYFPNATTFYNGQSTVSLFDDNITSLTAFKAATTIEIGASSLGFLQLNAANIWLPNAASIWNGQPAFTLIPTATALTIGATTGTANIRNANIYFPNATTIFSSQTGAVSVLNENPTAINAFGAATQLTLGATSGTANVRNANIYFPNATTIYGGQATISAFPATTALTLSAETGNTVVRNNLTANLTINARDINATVIGNVISANAKFANVTVDTLTSGRVTYAKANGTLRDDSDFTYDDVSNILNVGKLTLDGANATVKTTGTDQTLIIAPSGTGNVAFSNVRLTYVADPIDLQDVITKSYLETQLSSAVTNLVLDDTDIYLHDDGVVPGWITSNVDGILVSYTTSNTMALFGSDSTSIVYVDDGNSNVGINGTAFIGDDLTIADGGIVYVLDNTDSTAYNSGALQVTGGVGIGANLHVNGIAHITNATNAIDYNSGALVVDGGAAFEKDVYIKGNLYVDNIAAINYSIISIQDPLLYLTAANTYPYNYDIGFFSQFTGGVGNVYQHTGFARDNADGAWYLFSNVAAEPNGGIDFTGATYDKIVVGNLELRTTTGITTTETTAGIVNTTATTVNLAGAATTFTLGATSGTASLRNANIWLPNATSIDGSQTSVNLLTQNATTVHFANAATTLNVGANSGTLTIGNPTVVGTQTTQNLYNTTATTLNFAGAATSVVAGATSGTFNIRNANLYLPNASTLYSGQATLSVFEQPTAVNGFTSATQLTLGATTGTANIRNANIYLPNATTIYGGQATVSLLPATTTLTIGNSTGTANILYPNIYLPNATTIYTGQTSLSLADQAATVTAFNSATTLTLGATSGTANIRNANVYFPNASTIFSGQATVSLMNTVTTAVNAFGAATQLTLGATTGTANIRNANIYLPNATTIFSGQSTLNFANTVTTTLQIGGDATTILMANVNSTVGIRGNLTTLGVANVYNSTSATQFGEGALVVFGGATIGGKLFVGESANISSANITSNVSSTSTATGALTVTGGVGISGNLYVGGQLIFPTANISASTITTSGTTGALVVMGGVGFNSNLNVGGGAVINFNQNTEDFIVQGKYLTRLIHASSTTDTVSIGTSNTTPVSGATLRIGGTGAVIIPVGSTSDRPSTAGNVDIDGMVRLNTSLGTLEYYIAGSWQTSQGAFTVITADQFNGDGSNVAFTLTNVGTTAGTMVSVNGIIQIPTTSYSVSGNVLTFTEAPAAGDVVDARVLTTSTTVSSLVEAYNSFNLNAYWANISTGSSFATPRISTNTNGDVFVANNVSIAGNLTVVGNLNVLGDSNGQITIGDSAGDNVSFNADVNSSFIPNTNITYDLGSASQRWRNIWVNRIVYDQSATNAPSTSAVLIDTFATSSYSSAKYMVQSKQGTTSNVQVMEALVVHDSTSAYVVTYGVINTGNAMGTLTANITSGNVNLYFTATSGTVNSNVKVQTTYIV